VASPIPDEAPVMTATRPAVWSAVVLIGESSGKVSGAGQRVKISMAASPP
jgi:hypothetical protein